MESIESSMAPDRKPDISNIGIETTGIKTDDRGFIQIDDRCRTSVKTIFAAATHPRSDA